MKNKKFETLRRRKPLRVFKSKFLDFSLGFFGLLLASASAYFPWHVYTHSSEFGPPVLVFDGRVGDDQLIDQQTTASIRAPLWKRLSDNVDGITTGSVRNKEDFNLTPRRRPQRSVFSEPQEKENIKPVRSSDFELIFATKKRALLQHGMDLLPVGVGTELPDGSHVIRLSRNEVEWILTTSDEKEFVLIR